MERKLRKSHLEIFIGRGTFYRMGGDRAVEVKAGDVTNGPLTADRRPMAQPKVLMSGMLMAITYSHIIAKGKTYEIR